jgi:hypothetical protein
MTHFSAHANQFYLRKQSCLLLLIHYYYFFEESVAQPNCKMDVSFKNSLSKIIIQPINDLQFLIAYIGREAAGHKILLY